MTGKRILSALLGGLALVTAGCAQMGFSPEVTFSPDRPLVSRDLGVYGDKRAVLFLFRDYAYHGLAAEFTEALYTELLKAAPFAYLSYHPEARWFGLQTGFEEALSNAAALGAEFGSDVVLLGGVDRFVYSRNADSSLSVSFRVIDTKTGETVHAQQLTVRGYAGHMPPPLWSPSLKQGVERTDIIAAAANTLVRRMRPAARR